MKDGLALRHPPSLARVTDWSSGHRAMRCSYLGHQASISRCTRLQHLESSLSLPVSWQSAQLRTRSDWRSAARLPISQALHGLALQFCIQTSGQAHQATLGTLLAHRAVLKSQAALERVRKLNREHFLNGTKEEASHPELRRPSKLSSSVKCCSDIPCSML